MIYEPVIIITIGREPAIEVDLYCIVTLRSKVAAFHKALDYHLIEFRIQIDLECQIISLNPCLRIDSGPKNNTGRSRVAGSDREAENFLRISARIKLEPDRIGAVNRKRSVCGRAVRE